MSIDPASQDSSNEKPEEYCSRHIVALTAYADYETLSYSKYDHRTVSGFIIAIEEQWIWISSGHFFKKLLKEEFDSGWRFNHWQFMCFDPDDDNLIPFISFRVHDENGQFALEYPALRCNYDEVSGEDWAFIVLPDEYKKKLQRRNVSPLFPHQYKTFVESADEVKGQFFITGYPTKRSRLDKEDRLLHMELAVVGITRTDPAKKDTHSPLMFEGTINEDPHLPQIEGMSGGPLFFGWTDLDGREHHHLYGIQSYWKSKKQKVYAYRTPELMTAIEKFLKVKD